MIATSSLLADLRSAAPATINRELTWLKHMFRLAIDAGKLTTRPKISLPPESNARQGFFEAEQYRSMLQHMPDDLRPVVTFAYATGWRVKSEVLSLEWRQVAFKAGEVRLEPGTTKNKEGRTFPFTRELRALLERQDVERKRLQKDGYVIVGLLAHGRRRARRREEAAPDHHHREGVQGRVSGRRLSRQDSPRPAPHSRSQP